MNKAIVVLSGGQDSATTLHIAKTEANVIAAIHFTYGQRHAIEHDMAQWWAHNANIDLHTVPITALTHVGTSALTGPGSTHQPHPNLQHLPASFVPGRNLIFLTLAAAYAMKIGATDVYTGVCQTDYSGYPDCREPTIKHLETALRHGLDYPNLNIRTPLMHATKADTWRIAHDLNILDDIIEHTHTCYEGEHLTRHEWGYGCGECPACTIRKQGWNTYTN